MKEIWKPVKGWERYYAVSNLGRVRSLTRFVKTSTGSRIFMGRILKPGISAIYPQLLFSSPKRQARVYVHRLVAEQFIGGCPIGMEVCHNDGNPENNILSNLRYDTRRANSHDRRKHGTIVALGGVLNPGAKLSLHDVEFIRRSGRQFSQRALAKKFKVGHSTIGRALRNQSYKT